MNQPDSLFGILSDPTRLRIMLLLQQEGELCVCEIMHALEESQPKISRHLAFMRRAGTVSCRRQGTWMHYRLSSQMPVWATNIVAGINAQLRGQAPFANDGIRLNHMNNRPQSRCA